MGLGFRGFRFRRFRFTSLVSEGAHLLQVRALQKNEVRFWPLWARLGYGLGFQSRGNRASEFEEADRARFGLEGPGLY